MQHCIGMRFHRPGGAEPAACSWLQQAAYTCRHALLSRLAQLATTNQHTSGLRGVGPAAACKGLGDLHDFAEHLHVARLLVAHHDGIKEVEVQDGHHFALGRLQESVFDVPEPSQQGGLESGVESGGTRGGGSDVLGTAVIPCMVRGKVLPLEAT